jgi:hypothetical protein
MGAVKDFHQFKLYDGFCLLLFFRGVMDGDHACVFRVWLWP